MQSQNIIYEESLKRRDPSKTGQNFIPTNRDHVITTLEEKIVICQPSQKGIKYVFKSN